MRRVLLHTAPIAFLSLVLLGSVPSGPAHSDTLRGTAPPDRRLAPGQAPPPMRDAILIAEDGYDPAVVYNAKHDEYFVVWGDPYDIYGRRYSSRGESLGSATIADDPASRESAPDVAYDPLRDRYLVVWSSENIHQDYDIKGLFISWDLSAQTSEMAIEDGLGFYSVEPTLAHAPDQASGQGEFLVVWHNAQPPPAYNFVAGRRMNADGSGFATSSFTVASAAQKNLSVPDIAYDPSSHEYVVVFDDGYDVFAQRLSGVGDPHGGPIAVAGWPEEEAAPSIATCRNASVETRYLVAWTSWLAPNHRVFARFLGSDGAPGTFTGRNPISANGTGSEITCRWDLQYMLTWRGADAIEANLVYADGKVDDPFEVSQEGGAAKVASSGANYLFAWPAAKKDNPSYTDLYGRIVGHTKPVAAFSVSPERGNAMTVFAFDASSSKDAEYSTDDLEIRWDWEDDGTYDTSFSHTKTATWRYFVTGVHTIRVEVRDPYGLTDTTTAQVTTENAPPVASFRVTPESGGAGTVFTFDASLSGDPDGSPDDLAVRWDWMNDGFYDTEWSSTKTVTHTYPPDRFGTYFVRLQVRDLGGLTGEATGSVTIYRKPTAMFAVRPQVGDICTTYHVDGGGSYIPDIGGYSLVYRWSWGDSRRFDTGWSDDPTASHRYSTPGTRTIRMEVAEDPNGVSDVAARVVTVSSGCAVFLPATMSR